MAIYKELVKSFDDFITSKGISRESLNNDKNLYDAIRQYEKSTQQILPKGYYRDMKDYYYNKVYATGSSASPLFKLEGKQTMKKRVLKESMITDYTVNLPVEVEDYGTGTVELITPDSIIVRYADNTTKTILADELYKVTIKDESEEAEEAPESFEPEAGEGEEVSPAGEELPPVPQESKKNKLARMVEASKSKKIMSEQAKLRSALVKLTKIVEGLVKEEDELNDIGMVDPDGQAAEIADTSIDLEVGGDEQGKTVVDSAPDTNMDTVIPDPVTAEAKRLKLKKLAEQYAKMKKKLMEEDELNAEGMVEPEGQAAEIADVAIDQANQDEVGADGATAPDETKDESIPEPVTADNTAVESKRMKFVKKAISEMKILSGVRTLRG